MIEDSDVERLIVLEEKMKVLVENSLEILHKMHDFPAMVFFAVILGAGIIHILSGSAEIIRRRPDTTLYWVHSLWVTMIFIIHIQYWYTFTHEKHNWEFAYYIISILGPVLLYALASVLVPKKIQKEGLIMRDWYFEHSRLFFFLVAVSALYFIAMIFIEPIFVISTTGPNYERLPFRIILLTLSVPLFLFKNSKLHESVSVLCGGLLILYLIRIFEEQ